jgi:enamine deaminase RidA (YjgF/YER057c/UK114 family)
MAPHTAEARIKELSLTLRTPMSPAGTFVHVVRADPWVFAGGHFPITADGQVIRGKLGATLSTEEGYAAARLAAIAMLSSLRAELGTLDHIDRIVKLFGVVNATPEFIQHTQVINGASDLLVEVFGDAARHVRLAVGVSSLPFDLALEIEATCLLRQT